MVPNDRKYTKDHEWVKISGDTAYIGITDHAQHEMGDIVYCELPDVGKGFKSGDSFAIVESVKAASDIYTAIAGTIESVNDALIDNPEKLNAAPYAEHLVTIKIESIDESALLDASAYESLIGG